MEPRKEVLDSPTGWVDRHIRRYVETDGVSGYLMETVMPGLYAAGPRVLPFGSSLEICAFLLEHNQGNLLVYSVSTPEVEVHEIWDLGGISRQYLNHRHEATPAFLDAVAKHARRIVYVSLKDVGDDLELQTDAIPAVIAAKRAA